MDVIKGRVESLRLLVSSSDNSISYSAYFKINGKPVTLTGCNKVLHFEQGDEVILCGKIKKDGIFKAHSYANLTNDVYSVMRLQKSIFAISFVVGFCLLFFVAFIGGFELASGFLGGNSVLFGLILALFFCVPIGVCALTKLKQRIAYVKSLLFEEA